MLKHGMIIIELVSSPPEDVKIRKTLSLEFIFSVLVLMFVMSTNVSAQWFDHSFAVMGTEVRIRFWLEDPAQGDIAQQAVVDEMQRIDNTMSPYIESSLLYQINQQAALKPFKLSRELYQLIEKSIEISHLTQGVFDITFSSVGYMYDYRLKQKPTAQQLKNNLSLINYHLIELDPETHSIFLKKKGVRIDLGGIAKGYAVDNCISILKRFGAKDASVTAGGDTFVLGDNQGKLWRVGIKHPRAESKLVTVLPLENSAISTSGDYERFFIENGKRYHHILNPKTGKSASEVESVTILADTSTFADALSTSVFILGVQKGLALADSLPQVSAIIVDKNGKIFYSSDLVVPQ